MKINKIVVAALAWAMLFVSVARADIPMPTKLSVTLNPNGGTVSRRTVNFSGALWTKTVGSSLPKASRSDYAFKYWTTTRNDPTTSVSSSTSLGTLAEKGKKTNAYRYSSAITLYAYWGPKPPKPSASDGKYASYVTVTWPSVKGAVEYKVRRAASKSYSKSEVIGMVTATGYKDRDAACEPRKTFYYWVVPYDSRGVGTKNTSYYNPGHTRLGLTVRAPATIYPGDDYLYQCSVSTTDLCSDIGAANCTWKVTSGSDCLSVSKNGVVRGKKTGSAVLSVSYGGATVKFIVKVLKRGTGSLYSVEKTAYSK